MPSWFDTISGHGSAQIDSGASQFVYAWESWALSPTSPRVRQISTVEPLEFQYAGSIGLAALSGSSLVNKFFTQLRFEYEFHEVEPGAPYVDYVFWKLPPGVEVNLQVYW